MIHSIRFVFNAMWNQNKQNKNVQMFNASMVTIVTCWATFVEMAALYWNITTQFILIKWWNAKHDSTLEAIFNWPQFDLMFFVLSFFSNRIRCFFHVLCQFCVKSNVNIWLHCHWSQKWQPNDIFSMKVNSLFKRISLEWKCQPNC